MKTIEEHLEFLLLETRLRTLINTDKGCYIVSSLYTLDAGFETMVFPSDEEGNIIDFGELECKRYNTYSEMITGHKLICDKWNEGVKNAE